MNPLVVAAGVLLTGYLLGSLPSAVLVARARGRDIFRLGSGNMGAMNALRNLGAAPGLLVLGLDVGKGAAAAWLGSVAAGPLGGLLAGAAAVAGHAVSPWVGGRGGKALATTFGAGLPLYPAGAVAGGALLLILVALVRRTTPAALASLAVYPLVAAGVHAFAGAPTPDAAAVAAGVGVIAAISGARHVAALRHERY